MVVAKTKTDEKKKRDATKFTKNKASVRYPFEYVEKYHNKKSLEGRFQTKIQTAIDGSEKTVKTDPGKILHRTFIPGPFLQTEKKTEKIRQ